MSDPSRETARDPAPRDLHGAAPAAAEDDAATRPAATPASRMRREAAAAAEAAIGPARPAERSDALARIADRRLPLLEVLEDRFRRAPHGPPWLWVSRDPEGGIEAAAVAIRNPGRTATVLPPVSIPPRSRAATIAVLAAMATEILRGGEVDLLQAMTEPDHDSPGRPSSGGPLEEAGFSPLATLRFMERPPSPRPLPPSLPEGLAIETWTPAIREDAERLLARTYEGTLDCPGLAGVRQPADILAGHRGSGPFEPRLWRFLRRRGGELLGVALLNATPAAACNELVYFGLAAEARGQGLAAMLLGDLLAAAPPMRRIALAVDERNAPARRLYRRAGFVPGGARVAWIRTRSPRGPA